MPDSFLRRKIGALLWLLGHLERVSHRIYLCIDNASDELVRRRWEKTRDATRRR